MIHSIKINEFRALKNIDLNIGKYVTAIAGKNGLGKSTILAILANSCEMKSSDGKTILGTRFRSEFSEIFKASKKFDLKGSNKCIINIANIKNPNKITENKICRVTWQKGGERFRFIPETYINGEKINSRKYNYPVIYLGLSRLFPIGESRDEGVSVNSVNLTEEEKKFFVESYKDILNIDLDEEVSIDSIRIDETERKNGVGISTSYYDSISNSAGEDNIGQIILAILSFKRLKEKLKDNYYGGLFLIDEIDATLHPVAQIKLIDFLIKSCRNISLQVVFTTHSISLLEELSIKVLNNKINEVNNIEIVYLSKANGALKIFQNPSMHIIDNDLKLPVLYRKSRKINVFAEDEECRWFFKNLVEKYLIHLNFVNITLGCSELLRLNNSDVVYFSNVLFVVDGDVQQRDIDKLTKSKNIIKLPGNVRPEEVIYRFLINLHPEHEIWIAATEIGFTKENIKIHGPESKDYKGQPRDRYKKWFNDYKEHIEHLDVLKYWIKENPLEYDKFVENFKRTYNIIATRKFYPKIHN